MIGDEISCLKNVGFTQLKDANSKCQSLNANQILPRSRQESDDLVPALLSLGLASEDGNILVSIGVYMSNEGWRNSTGQLISYFNWLPDEPENVGGNQDYAGFQINGVNGTAGWASYSGAAELNVICTKKAGQGENNRLIKNLTSCNLVRRLSSK